MKTTFPSCKHKEPHEFPSIIPRLWGFPPILFLCNYPSTAAHLFLHSSSFDVAHYPESLPARLNAKGILNRLLSLATNHINNQINLAWGFKQDLDKLCERLRIIQGLLHDAENQKITLEAMMAWLKTLKPATCKAENVLDKLAYEALRRKVQDRIRNQVHDLFTLSDPLSFRVKMANKVNNINVLLNRICKVANDIGLRPAKQLIRAIVEPMEFRNTGPSIGDTTVVGRDHDVLVVLDMLLRSDIEGELLVTAVVGMAGF
ncbi:putative disease resistance protein At3g14460 isoform X3 [Rhododendron vialii]|nr:putative disease resistance protein At3g14460 isoform X3 [Rhododendron vialii]